MDDVLSQLSDVRAGAELGSIQRFVLHHRHAAIMLKGSYKWKLGTFEDTLLKDESYMLEEWEECYLPDQMRMQVLGEVHHTSWDPAKSSLVLMVCEDGKVYAFADEHLHLVAENLKALVTAGITFPSKTVFHYGQSFEGMTEKELEEVRASEEMKKAKDMHRKEAEKWGLKIMEAFREVEDCYEVPAFRLSRVERRKKRIANSPLVRQANCFIYTAFRLWKVSPNHTVALLVDEMVHSILFSAHILDLKIEPEEMFADDVTRMLFDKFSNASREFINKLPRRTPFSCLLELIVNIKGKENPDKVKKELSDIINTLDCNAANQLLGSALCITHSEDFQQIFSYGASIPKAERRYKEIWIALSCVHTWHPHVSYTVMKYSRGETHRETIPSLRSSCTTYDVKTLTEKPPCSSCCELFSFEPVNQNLNQNMYGNCAEVEAISKLLWFNDAPDFDSRTRRKWDMVRDHTKCDLMRRLLEVRCYEFSPDIVYEPTVRPIRDRQLPV